MEKIPYLIQQKEILKYLMTLPEIILKQILFNYFGESVVPNEDYVLSEDFFASYKPEIKDKLAFDSRLLSHYASKTTILTCELRVLLHKLDDFTKEAGLTQIRTTLTTVDKDDVLGVHTYRLANNGETLCNLLKPECGQIMGTLLSTDYENIMKVLDYKDINLWKNRELYAIFVSFGLASARERYAALNSDTENVLNYIEEIAKKNPGKGKIFVR